MTTNEKSKTKRTVTYGTLKEESKLKAYVPPSHIHVSEVDLQNNRQDILDFVKRKKPSVDVACEELRVSNEPKRITLTTESCFDNVFSNMDEELYASRTFDPHRSDHQMQELKFKVPRNDNRDNIVEKYIMNETNTRSFENLLNNTNWKDAICSSAEGSFENFHDTLYTIFNIVFPRKSIRSTRISKITMNEPIYENLQRSYQRSRNCPSSAEKHQGIY
ncbi:hypothetical protein HHI36_020040 [Cryptolaemus montrouzieri]|uniref:Uncharacterized protein n=1 Tax=Cryptolaemus montrouzieri TaxID=559131 RepID=A0ABD2N918_9CUCU